jgi:cell division protein FtsB
LWQEIIQQEGEEMKRNGNLWNAVVVFFLVAIFIGLGMGWAYSIYQPQLKTLNKQLRSIANNNAILRAKIAELQKPEGWYWDELERLNRQNDNLNEQLRIASIRQRLMERDFKRKIIAIADNYADAFIEEQDKSEALSKQIDTLIAEKRKLNAQLSKEAFDWMVGKPFKSQDELVRFLADDDTDKLTYDDEGSFVCVEYTTLLMRNAAVEGYRIYPTLVAFIDGKTITSLHTMDFAVVEVRDDDGKVYEVVYLIEPQNDQWWQFGIWDEPDSWQMELYPWLP